MEEIAKLVIRKWLRKGNMTRCLRDILPSSNLDAKERENVSRIVHEVVRWKRWYDFVIGELGLERSPETYIRLAKGEIDTGDAEKRIPREMFVGIRYSFSDYVAGVIENFPELINYLNKEAPTTLCVNLNKNTRDGVMELLRKEGFSCRKGEVETAVITESSARYSIVVRNGMAHVQDESSQLVSKIASELGRRIIDYCAGNGGKTLAISSLTRNSVELHAYDADQRKMEILKERAELYGAEVRIWRKDPDEKFDVVLVDAPCSGVGVARRNPEAKYVESSEGYRALQLKILGKVRKIVSDGGYIVYSVCTFIPRETDEVVDEAENGLGLEVVKMDHELMRNTRKGALTQVPDGDIMYVSILRATSR